MYIYHIPLIQALYHLRTLFYRCHVVNTIKAIKKQCKLLKLEQSFKDLSEFEIMKLKQNLVKHTKEYIEALEFKDYILEQIQKFKIYEAFLESGPQSILQLWIFLFYGSQRIELVVKTFATSFASLVVTSASVLLHHPVKVSLS